MQMVTNKYNHDEKEKGEWRKPFFCIPSGFRNLSKSVYQYLENIHDNIRVKEDLISSGPAAENKISAGS